MTTTNGQDQRAKKIDDDERIEIQHVVTKIQQEVEFLVREMGALNSQEMNELSQLLRDLREQDIQAFLAKQSITNAHLPGIGAKIKGRLQAAGIRNASDVIESRVHKVEGIGTAKADVLLNWAATLRRQATATAPNSLPAATVQRIHDNYQAARTKLESAILHIQKRVSDDKRIVMNQYTEMRIQIQSARNELDQEFDNEKRMVGEHFEKEKRTLFDQYKALRLRIADLRRMKEQQRQEITRKLLQAKIKLTMKIHEAGLYENLSFQLFLRKVICFWET